MYVIVLLAILVIEIILLVKTVKKSNKKYWFSLFCIEIISMIIPFVTINYLDNHVSTGFFSGLENVGAYIICMGSLYIYFILFCISVIIRIIKIEKKNKCNPLLLIIAFILLLYGTNYLYVDIKDGYGKVKTIGTIIEYDKTVNDTDWMVIKFNANGSDHYYSYPVINGKIGDKKEYYYYIKDGKYELTSWIENNKSKWIPSYLISFILIIIRVILLFNKKKKHK